MKKIYLFMIAGLLTLTLCMLGCGSSNSSEETDGTKEVSENSGSVDGEDLETEEIAKEDEKSEYEILVEEGVLQYSSSNDEYTYIIYDTYIEITSYLGTDTVVNIPSEIEGLPVLVIGGAAFTAEDYEYEERMRYAAITSVIFPEHLVAIGGSAFENCSGLTEVTLPEELASLGPSAFRGCTSLTSVIIEGEWLNEIAERAFQECTALRSVTIGEGIVRIEKFAFIDCLSITSLSLPDTLQYVGMAAFEDAFDREESIDIVLPESVTEIEERAFDCSWSGSSGVGSITIYNADCVLGANCICHDTVVYGYSGSTAANYCASGEYSFQILE